VLCFRSGHFVPSMLWLGIFTEAVFLPSIPHASSMCQHCTCKIVVTVCAVTLYIFRRFKDYAPYILKHKCENHMQHAERSKTSMACSREQPLEHCDIYLHFFYVIFAVIINVYCFSTANLMAIMPCPHCCRQTTAVSTSYSLAGLVGPPAAGCCCIHSCKHRLTDALLPQCSVRITLPVLQRNAWQESSR